jgi:DNA polymerase-4
MKKPDGLTFILEKELPHRLFSLKLRDLPGIGPKMEEKLNHKGFTSIKQLCELDRHQMKSVWGSVYGEYFYDWMRGVDVNLPRSRQSSLGHQHVLSPEKRNPLEALEVLKKLLFKLSVRLRKEELFAKRLSINVKLIHPNDHWETHIKMEETQDSLLLMNHLTKHFPTKWKGTLLRVGVVLSDLVPDSKHQISLFEDVPRLNLMKAIDKINIKYGIEAVGPGSVIAQKENKEPKIAFQRVPGLDEFES